MMTRYVFLLLLLGVSVRAEIIDPARMVNWTNLAGLTGGFDSYRSNYTSTVDLTTQGAVGDNVTDNRAVFEAVLTGAGSNTVLYLPEGTYYMSDRAHVWRRIQPGGVILRGAGPGKTIIRCPGTLFFTFGAAEWPNPTVKTFLGADANSGDTTLTLTNGHGVIAGSLWALDILNDTNTVLAQNSCYDVDRNCTRAIINMVYVTNVVGNTAYLEKPLVYDFPMALVPRISLMSQASYAPAPYHLEGIGIESLTLTRGDNFADGQPHVEFSNARNVWLYDVHLDDINRYGSLFFQCANIAVQHCTIGPGQEGALGGSNRGYGLWPWSATYMLVEDNVFNHLTVPIALPSVSGSVVSYNFMTNMVASAGISNTWVSLSVAGHGPHPVMDLIEGNVSDQLQIDNYYGSASHFTVFRNLWRGWQTGKDRNIKAIDIQSWNNDFSVVGNVLGHPDVDWTHYDATNQIAFDIIGGVQRVIYRIGYPNMGNDSVSTGTPGGWMERALTSLYRHGNYDYFSESTIWNATNADHTLPASLYLTSKPSWWGTNAWPAIGPDVTPMVSAIPAQVRYLTGYAPPEGGGGGEDPPPPEEPPAAGASGRLTGSGIIRGNGVVK